MLFAVLIYELVGPALTKRSLLAVGEIKPEGRVSNRKLNEKHAPLKLRDFRKAMQAIWHHKPEA